LARVPGLERIVLANMSPMYGFAFDAVFYASGESLPKWSDGVPSITAVSPEYFATVRLRLIRGRGLAATDVRNGGVAIVNRTLQRSASPNEDAIGQCLRVGNLSAPPLRNWVVEDARRARILETLVRQVYVAIARSGDYSAITPWSVLVPTKQRAWNSSRRRRWPGCSPAPKHA
jgi:hypothetical protein